MSDLEYYVAILAIVGGIVYLVWKRAIARDRIQRLRRIQESAKTHYTYTSRPAVDNSIEFEPDETLDFSETIANIQAFDADIWGPTTTHRRNIR